jgi:hypothetical protein
MINALNHKRDHGMPNAVTCEYSTVDISEQAECCRCVKISADLCRLLPVLAGQLPQNLSNAEN